MDRGGGGVGVEIEVRLDACGRPVVEEDMERLRRIEDQGGGGGGEGLRRTKKA